MSSATHLHHKIAKSRGGTNDKWNLIELDPYTHAYEHALDFVLFEHAPQFDFRHEAWPLLPKGLQEAVLKEHVVRFKSYMNGPCAIKGKKRAHNPGTGEDGFFDEVPEGFTPGVPVPKRRPKGSLPGCTRLDIQNSREVITDLYLSGESTVSLGEIYNTSARTINNWLIKWDVPKRNTSRLGRPDRKPRKTEGYSKRK